MSLYPEVRFRLTGDRGLLAEYGDTISPEVNRKVRQVAAALEAQPLRGVIEVIPTYRSLFLLYDPMTTSPEELQAALLELEERLTEVKIPPPREVEIPVCYGGEFGPDLAFVAESHGLSPEEVIRLHCQPLYQVYMVGFTPGFPFLGGLPKELHTPRRPTPRERVPAGSVGIAGEQTGIYPIESPGGWQLIGRTPLKVFDPNRPDPFLLKAGDLVRFRPIEPEEFRRIAEEG